MTAVPKHIWDKMSRADQAKYPCAPSLFPDLEKQAELIKKSERKEQKLFNNWINRRVHERRLYCINPRSDKETTIRVGHPDYSLWLPGGQSLLLEMKVADGIFSKHQLYCIGLLQDLGHKVRVPGSCDEAMSIVEPFLT